jgi:hypothetical protein
MLLKIGHALETYGTGKLETLEIGDLTPPSWFSDATPKKLGFASRVQVEEFVKREFPDVDPSTFFSTFIWKIPAEGYRIRKDTQQVRLHEPEPVVADPGGLCRARNSLCNLERTCVVADRWSLQRLGIACATLKEKVLLNHHQHGLVISAGKLSHIWLSSNPEGNVHLKCVIHFHSIEHVFLSVEWHLH